MIRLKAPLDVQIEITEICNQKCRHCYNYWRHVPVAPKKELDVAGFSNIVRQLSANKVGLITFTGGEPMLRKAILFELVGEAHELGIETGINSNAVLIKADGAKELANRGLDHALISILGPTRAVHESIGGPGANYKATLSGIANLQQAGIPVSVNMVVSKTNLHEIYATASAMKALGIWNFCAGPMLPSCAANIPLCLSGDECKLCFRELLRIARELSLNVDVLEPIPRCLFDESDEAEFVRFFGNRICSAAVSSCAISSTGFMRPCIHSDEVFGQVLPNNFAEVWRKMDSWASPEILPKECRDCNGLMVCEGGCRMSAKVTSGRYDGPDLYMTRAISDCNRAILLPTDPDFQLDQDQTLCFNRRCLLRQEENGFIAYTGGKLEYLTEKGFEFVLMLKQADEITCRALAERLGYQTEDVLSVVKRLIRSRILLRREVA